MASSLTAAQKAILQRAKANIPTGLATERIQWPNTVLVPPDVAAAQALWAKIDLLWGDGFEVTLGAVGSNAGRNTIAGVIQISVFGPSNKGEAAINTVADLWRDVFSRQQFGVVRCGVASGPMPAPNPDSAWWQRIVRVPFTVDELL